MVQVPATMVTVGLKLAGDVASFSRAQRDALRDSLKASLSCAEPACFLTLRIQAGSIDVEGLLTILQVPPTTATGTGTGANTAPAATDSTVAAVQAAATTLLSSPPATISSALGVAVTSADPVIRTQANVVVPLAMGPPPPMPPLPPPTPPQLPLAVKAPNGSYSYSYGSYSYSYSYTYGQRDAPTAPPAPPLDGPGTGDTQTAGQVGASSGALIGIIAGAACAGVGMVGFAAWWMRRRCGRCGLRAGRGGSSAARTLGGSQSPSGAAAVGTTADTVELEDKEGSQPRPRYHDNYHAAQSTSACAIDGIGETSASLAEDQTNEYV